MNYCIANPEDLPDDFKAGFKLIMDSFKQSSIGAIFNDIYISSRAMYASLAMGCVYCIVYIYLMSIFAEQIAWLCVILVQLGLIAASYGAWIYRENFVEQYEEAKLHYEQNKGSLSGEEQAEAEKSLMASENLVLYAMILCVTFGILALTFLCAICCGYRSLKLAIDVIDASADFLRCTKRILFVPFLYFFLSMVFIISWVYAFACVCSMNEIEANPIIPQMKTLAWSD